MAAISNYALTVGCVLCHRPVFSECPGCLVTRYCGAEHESLHRKRHRSACEAIAIERERLFREESRLRIIFQPFDPFESLLGSFWEFEQGRTYLLARMDLIRALRRLRTMASVEEQLGHVREMLRLSTNDEVMARNVEPALLLRLNRDQECYDTIKRWRLAGKKCNYDWLGMTWNGEDDELMTSCNVFEAADYLCDHEEGSYDGTILEHTVAMMLLKIKLLLDLTMLQKATYFEQTTLGTRLPHEIQNEIRSYLPRSSIVACDTKLVEHGDHSEAISSLTLQIDQLYEVVKAISDRFFPGMIDHYASFDSKFKIWDRVGASECPGDLRNSYDSWIETPGAVEYIGAKVRRDPTSLKTVYLHF